MKKLFYVVLLFELILCCPCFAMFRDFFTEEEVEEVVRGHVAAKLQEQLSSQDPGVYQLAAERVIDFFMRRHIDSDKASLEMQRDSVAQNLRLRRVFEMLDYYSSRSPRVSRTLLRNSEVFLSINATTIEDYTLENLSFSINWYMRLLSDSTSRSPTPGYIFDDKETKEGLLWLHMQRSLKLLDDLVTGDIDFSADPFFPGTVYAIIEFIGKYGQDFFDSRLRDDVSISPVSLTNRMIRQLMTPSTIHCCGGELNHALLMECLIPLYRRDTYIDYLLFNGFRGIIARAKLVQNEDEGLEYILGILTEQNMCFPITSEGVTENRPPIDPWFSKVVHQLYRRKYKQELRGLVAQPLSNRDYRTLHQLENLMELYKGYEVQGLKEARPHFKEFEALTSRTRQAQQRSEMYKKALANAQRRQEGRIPSRAEKLRGKRGPVEQNFPKQGLIYYNQAKEYMPPRAGAAAASGGAASASSSQVHVVENAPAASTSMPGLRESLSAPLVVLTSRYYVLFENIMNDEDVTITRQQFENFLVQLQGLTNGRSNATGHTVYNITPIGDNPNLSKDNRSFLQAMNTLPINTDVDEDDISALLAQLGLENNRQGVTVSVKLQETIPPYQLTQIRDHLRGAGYTLETVGEKIKQKKLKRASSLF